MTGKSRLADRRRTGRRDRTDVAKTSLTRKVLVVDVGGTSVKVLATDQHRSFPSGPLPDGWWPASKGGTRLYTRDDALSCDAD